MISSFKIVLGVSGDDWGKAQPDGSRTKSGRNNETRRQRKNNDNRHNDSKLRHINIGDSVTRDDGKQYSPEVVYLLLFMCSVELPVRTEIFQLCFFAIRI
jgi:hypothetical protein